jgi:hypothetical protein
MQITPLVEVLQERCTADLEVNPTDLRRIGVKGEARMSGSIERLRDLRPAVGLSLVVSLVAITAFPLFGSTPSFSVPNDVALRIRLDDTLTSVDSEVGDPFSATVVEEGDYQNARVYGHVAQVDLSGRIKGHTGW